MSAVRAATATTGTGGGVFFLSSAPAPGRKIRYARTAAARIPTIQGQRRGCFSGVSELIIGPPHLPSSQREKRASRYGILASSAGSTPSRSRVLTSSGGGRGSKFAYLFTWDNCVPNNWRIHDEEVSRSSCGNSLWDGARLRRRQDLDGQDQRQNVRRLAQIRDRARWKKVDGP